LTFDHNFSKCGPIFKTLSLTNSPKKLYVTITGSSTSP